jgi:AraC-like DNA-binding protein
MCTLPYLHDHITKMTRRKPVSIFCDIHGITRQQREAFLKEYGLTIGQLMHIAVMEHAKKLIHDTDKPMKVIATEVGYRNIFTFSEAYKIHFGHSPKHDRQVVSNEIVDVHKNPMRSDKHNMLLDPFEVKEKSNKLKAQNKARHERQKVKKETNPNRAYHLKEGRV